MYLTWPNPGRTVPVASVLTRFHVAIQGRRRNLIFNYRFTIALDALERQGAIAFSEIAIKNSGEFLHKLALMNRETAYSRK